MANPKSLRTGAKLVERAGHPIAASQMCSAADEIERLRNEVDDLRGAVEAYRDRLREIVKIAGKI